MGPCPLAVTLGNERGAARLDRCVVHIQLYSIDAHVVVSSARADFQQVPGYSAHHATSVAFLLPPSSLTRTVYTPVCLQFHTLVLRTISRSVLSYQREPGRTTMLVQQAESFTSRAVKTNTPLRGISKGGRCCMESRVPDLLIPAIATYLRMIDGQLN
jgi:hypothetical protein